MFLPFLLRQSCDTFTGELRQLHDEPATGGRYDEGVRDEEHRHCEEFKGRRSNLQYLREIASPLRGSQ